MSTIKYYGFVYIWMDKKRKMFYIGSHMGDLNDGYIGSNTRLRRAYKKRPSDFKRRILSFCYENDKKVLQKEENRWLNMINAEELGRKYFNLKRVAAGGKTMESYTEQQKLKYRDKLKKAAGKGDFHPKNRAVICFGKYYPSINKAREQIGFNPARRLISRRYKDFYYANEGPITEKEWLEKLEKEEESKKRGIEARAKAISLMPKDKRIEKARKSAKTRKITCPYIGERISESLKKRPGRKVSINNIIYEKGRIASEILNINYGTVKARLRNKAFPSWFYVDNPNKLQS